MQLETKEPGPDLAACATPALVLDRARVARNAETMIGRCRARGVALRPHMKTLKCVEAARLAVDPAHGGIAVATLNEATFFAEAGFSDIQLAVCLSPDKLSRAAAITARAPGFSFFIDSLEMADAVMAHVGAQGGPLRLWLEIDCGEHRTGFDPLGPELVEAARRLSAVKGVTVVGVATHAGHAYGATTLREIARIAEDERSAAVGAAHRLRAAGLRDLLVSVGSTPTAVHGGQAEGVDEVRAGVYLGGDLFQAGIGSMGLADLAVTVLATVISHNRTRNQIVLDAGGLALSKDRSTAALAGRDAGYGLVLDASGEDAFGGLHVVDVHQEHGEIRREQALPFERLPIGARVRIAPNHVCMTAAMYESYLVVEGDGRVLDVWPRTNGWS